MSLSDKEQNPTNTIIKDWLSKSVIKGTIDDACGFSVSMETTDDNISSTLKDLALTGREIISIGDQTEEFTFFDQLQANNNNYLMGSGYINSVGDQSQPFSYKLFLDCLYLPKLQVQKLIIKDGPLIDCPIKFGDLELRSLSIIKDQYGDLQVQGEIVGGSKFVYVFDVTEDEPDTNYVVNATNAFDVEQTEKVNQTLIGNAEGDELFLILGHYSMIENGIELSFSGQAKLEDAHEDEEDYDEELNEIEVRIDEREFSGQLKVFKGGSEVKLFEINNLKSEHDRMDDDDLEYDEEVSINLEVKQYVLKEKVLKYKNFVKVFETAEPDFRDWRFEESIRISDLSCSSKVEKCKSEDEYYSRQINCSINFKINSLTRLKKQWENEGIIEEGEINWFELGFYWIEDIDPIFLEHEDET